MASEFRESEWGPATAVAPLAIASTTLLSYSVRQRIFLYLGVLIVLLAYGTPLWSTDRYSDQLFS